MDNFTSIAHEYFDKIAEEYGMRCIEEREFHIRYGNDQISLGILWDRLRSYEIGLGISLRDNVIVSGPWTIELSDILRQRGATDFANEIATLRVESEEDLREPIRKLATLTKSYASRFLSGDPEAYAAMAEFMNRQIAQYNAQLPAIGADVRALYQEANDAWTNQDYRKVVEIYRSISFPLPPFARERLSIAQRKIEEASEERSRID